MSVFDESESAAGSVKKKHFDDREEWGDDVSILSRYEGSSPSVIIFKLILALLLIGACSGALVYSIINSEEESKHEPYESPEDFPIDTNQESISGTLTITYRSDQAGGGTIYTYDNISINWYQDSDKKRIVHRVGLKDAEWRYTYFVYETVTFIQTKYNCNKTDMGYKEFLSGFGLDYVKNQQTELIMIKDHYTETAVYEGEPPTTVLISGAHPSLVRGYASETQRMTYGWQQYFSHNINVNTSIYKQEYFFENMQHKEPDYAILDDVPAECLE